MPRSLNPNHPVTQRMHDQWHKVAALILHKLGHRTLDITSEDIERFTRDLGNGGAVAMHAKADRLTVQLVNEIEAEALARKAGGLPT